MFQLFFLFLPLLLLYIQVDFTCLEKSHLVVKC